MGSGVTLGGGEEGREEGCRRRRGGRETAEEREALPWSGESGRQRRETRRTAGRADRPVQAAGSIAPAGVGGAEAAQVL